MKRYAADEDLQPEGTAQQPQRPLAEVEGDQGLCRRPDEADQVARAAADHLSVVPLGERDGEDLAPLISLELLVAECLERARLALGDQGPLEVALEIDRGTPATLEGGYVEVVDAHADALTRVSAQQVTDLAALVVDHLHHAVGLGLRLRLEALPHHVLQQGELLDEGLFIVIVIAEVCADGRGSGEGGPARLLEGVPPADPGVGLLGDLRGGLRVRTGRGSRGLFTLGWLGEVLEALTWPLATGRGLGARGHLLVAPRWRRTIGVAGIEGGLLHTTRTW